MTTRDEERRLRRVIAAGAGLAEARRLVELLEAKADVQLAEARRLVKLLEAKADVQVARVRVPDAWRQLMGKMPTEKDLDFRSMHILFPNGYGATLYIVSDTGPYKCGVDMFVGDPSDEEVEYQDFFCSGLEDAFPERFVAEHEEKTYVLELD